MQPPKRNLPQRPAETPEPQNGVPVVVTPLEPPAEVCEPPQPYWSEYGEYPVTPACPDALLRELLMQVRDALSSRRTGVAVTPRLDNVDDAQLNVRIELFDQSGRVFLHAADLPLIGFASVDAVRHGVSTVQAALTTLVIAPLVGKVTQYLDSKTHATAHLEIPLKDAKPPGSSDGVDIEGGDA